MELTPKVKAYIDSLNHYELLSAIRYAPVGDRHMQGPSGEYWLNRRTELAKLNPLQAAEDSKRLERF